MDTGWLCALFIVVAGLIELVRLACPPGGLVLDPFAGSGTTLLACRAEGRHGIGVELEQEYADIARARLEAAPPAPDDEPTPDLFAEVA
jgi:site-specific DNA-methyltransferase (adenine-specific)